MSSPPVIFVVGPVGHGKSAAREILARLTHLKGASCSDVIYAFLAFRKDVSQESLRALPKESFRPQLIEAGDFMVGTLDAVNEQTAKSAELDASIYRRPSALIRTLYQNGYNVIDGVRRRAELVEAVDHLDWNGIRSLVIHIHDPRKPRIADNSELLSDLCQVSLTNDGTLEQLEEKLKKALESAFGPLVEPEPMAIVDLPQ